MCVTLIFFVRAQVAMQRAKVCVRLVSVSGKTHMRLVKSKDPEPEITDHEAAYRDNTGEDACVRCARPNACAASG